MPNWCSTRITINHYDENELKNLEALINVCMEKNYMENGFGLGWLGNIVGNSGIGTIDTGKETDLRCRGWLSYMELYDNQLTIDTETAWIPMLEMWIKLLNKYLPDAELIYQADEPGCGIHCTNDPTLIGKYVIDSWNDDIDYDPEADKETVIFELQRYLKTTETELGSLLNMLYEMDEPELSINEWKFSEIEGWD